MNTQNYITTTSTGLLICVLILNDFNDLYIAARADLAPYVLFHE